MWKQVGSKQESPVSVNNNNIVCVLLQEGAIAGVGFGRGSDEQHVHLFVDLKDSSICFNDSDVIIEVRTKFCAVFDRTRSYVCCDI